MGEHDLAGHIYYILMFFGMVLIASKYQIGWFLRFLGELGWVSLGFQMGMTSIWFWGLIFAAVDTYGYFKWGKK